MTDAIVLAGGRDPDLDAQTPNKAFLHLAGRPLIAFVVAALQGTHRIGRIAAVGPADELRRILPTGVAVVPDAGTIMDNVVGATRALGSQGLTLVAASDIPLLTSSVVEEFLGICAKDTADFYYAVVPREAMDAQFPGARKTYAHLTDGTFCGGSVMLFNPQVIDRVRPFIERALAARKRPWMLAQLFGWAIIMKFAAGRLSIEELVARAAEVVGITVRPVIIRRPELALDVDMGKPENLQLIRAALEAKSPAR